jgi:hypothetical protein
MDRLNAVDFAQNLTGGVLMSTFDAWQTLK